MNQLGTIGAAILDRHGFFSIDQIIKGAGLSRQKCRDVLVLFCQEGLIRQIKKSRKERFGKPPTYAMIYRVIDRKRLAARIAPRRCENTVQDRMWFVIWNKFKNNGSFNLHDLTVLAGAEKGTARWYLKALRRAGYILPSRKAGPGVEWRLTGKFGPERPYVKYGRKVKGRKLQTAIEKKRNRIDVKHGPL
jgi:DNA-binding IclR family transcriptional regulator